MEIQGSLLNTLVERDDSLLALIDIQKPFLEKLNPEQANVLIGRVNWLLMIARLLEVPVMVTAEDIEIHGQPDESLDLNRTDTIPIFNKMVFDLSAEPVILQAVKDSGQRTVVLAGLETDVCIAQSAIGLQKIGYSVVVLSDLTCSPGAGHQAGLERIRGAGILVTTLKGLYYEWVRTVDLSNILGVYINESLGPPPGVIL